MCGTLLCPCQGSHFPASLHHRRRKEGCDWPIIPGLWELGLEEKHLLVCSCHQFEFIYINLHMDNACPYPKHRYFLYSFHMHPVPICPTICQPSPCYWDAPSDWLPFPGCLEKGSQSELLDMLMDGSSQTLPQQPPPPLIQPVCPYPFNGAGSPSMLPLKAWLPPSPIP
ncbi:hypothetical protein KIL84_003458 [Mauremys mutica]|uniref:Uncharacterized protein n=1 Tax=Mauremys mutica TaxID=74926 RepID=A0A9D3WVX5_9SAUR|nr:hypothetical protein KIL84_003458 [Mauremys mutica]